MKKEEVVETIKDVVKQVLQFDIVDVNQNIIDCRQCYPVIYMVYVLDKLAEIYGKEVYDILRSNDYRVLCVSNLADAIVDICDENSR